MSPAFHRRFVSPIGAALALATLAALSRAGGSPENVILIVDPRSASALEVANHYRHVRGVPDRNVIYLAPNPGSYATWRDSVRPAFLGALVNAGIDDHVDYVVLAPGAGFQMSAPGLVSDGCAAVTRFSVTGPFALARAYAAVPPGTPAGTTNHYATSGDVALAFDAQSTWAAGNPTLTGTRYFLAASLGYDGALGNSVSEILNMIDRSVAADGSFPTGTFHLCQTTDAARSGPRHGLFPAVVAGLTSLGQSALHLQAVLPPAGATSNGIMTGWADPLIDTTAFTLVPGAFCDHLTSYAATFDTASQTKMSRWIAKGASGTSGAVEEPCNYAGKFPTARLHSYYAQGASLGEAWFRSLGYAPFQVLFTGDPLTRPFAHLPQPVPSGLPVGTASGTLAVSATATTTHPTAGIGGHELLVDGVSFGTRASGAPWALDTAALADGWHDVRVLSWDDTPVRSTGRWTGALVTQNHGRTALATTPVASGTLTSAFDVSVSAAGGNVSTIDLVQGGRVIASTPNASATLRVFGRTLGAGRSRLSARATFTDGRAAQSAPLDLDVASTAGTPAGSAPIAYGYVKHARATETSIVELPAAFDEDLAAATWTVITAPAQGVLLAPAADAPYRLVKPNPGALGPDVLSFQVTTPGGTSTTATVTIVWESATPCSGPVNYCVSDPNSTGLAATISGSGSLRFVDNAFTLSAANLPPFTSGVFFYGDAPTQVVFGNGYRCVAGPIVRLSVQAANVFGEVFRPIDVLQAPFASGPGVLQIGTTKRFQFWFRDTAGGGAGFDTTDGLAVTFCP